MLFIVFYAHRFKCDKRTVATLTHVLEISMRCVSGAVEMRERLTHLCGSRILRCVSGSLTFQGFKRGKRERAPGEKVMKVKYRDRTCGKGEKESLER